MLQRSQSHSDEPLFINLTPMIDVILTLLVFFITASRLSDWEEEDKLDVAVPQVGYATPLTQAPDDIVILVAIDGSITINGQAVSAKDAENALRAARENFKDQGVLIRADGRTTHQKVADVLSLCHAAGISRIRYSVQELGR